MTGKRMAVVMAVLLGAYLFFSASRAVDFIRAGGLVPILLGLAIAAPQAYVDATSAAPPPRAALPPAATGAPDVVLVVLDTVRAKNVTASRNYWRRASDGSWPGQPPAVRSPTRSLAGRFRPRP